MLLDLIQKAKLKKSAKEQINILLASQKEIYFFGGIGSMSLGSVNARYLQESGGDFSGYLVNKAFMSCDSFNSKPVFVIEETTISRDVNVVIGIANWFEAKRELEKYGFKHLFLFDSFAEIYLDSIDLDYLEKHQEDFEWTYSQLQDSLSKETMIAYLQGKIFHNYDALGLTLRGGGYFNSVLNFGENEIMIDCGAYNGDTALGFAKKSPEYLKIYALEPNPQLFQELQQNTVDLRIEAIQKGVSSEKKVLFFQDQQSGCSKVCPDGELKIEVDKIDDLLRGEERPITFIKMDIEGSELKALHGASQTITKFKPKLAICVYHRKEDLFAIPQFLYSLNKDYKFFLRNHQGIPEDLVLYAY